jgi:cytochrome c-type biogenesis protein CcmH
MPSPKRFGGATAPAVAMLVLAISAGAACSKQDEATKATGVPPLANAPAPAAPAAPPPVPVAAPVAPAPAPAPPEKPADPNATISGQVTLPAAQRANVAATDTIFLIARRVPDGPGVRGSLVAVKKLSAAKFPIAFTMSAADMPFQGGAFDGEMQLSVRDDKDGDPITRRKGDVFGLLAKVKVGDHGVKIALDQLQKEDESLAGNMPHGSMGGPGALPPGHP